MTEYMSKKISLHGDKILKYVQAHYQLEKGEKATESEVLEMALEHIAEEKYDYREKAKKEAKTASSEEDEVWKRLSEQSLQRAWEKEDDVWDKIAKKKK